MHGDSLRTALWECLLLSRKDCVAQAGETGQPSSWCTEPEGARYLGKFPGAKRLDPNDVCSMSPRRHLVLPQHLHLCDEIICAGILARQMR